MRAFFICADVVGLLFLLVLLYQSIKSPPRKGVMKWRTMTVSSVFNFPGFTLLIVVGIAVLITSLFFGHIK
jgi:hypothetical protein